MSPAFVLQFMVHVACPSSGVSTPLNSGVPKQAVFKAYLVNEQTTRANTEVLRVVHMQREGSGILRYDAVSMGGGSQTFRRILLPSLAQRHV